ncbi:MAG TPA: protoheme IX farnesyltransferase, partial [Spirochaetia bacterium]|nr:protoheme IX farnesyltransferase [Spirochaetia bacterium]
MSTHSEQTRPSQPRRALGRVSAYLELTKPRITLLVLAVAVGSFYLAQPKALDWPRLVESAVGVSLLAFGIFALNHYVERDSDSRMLRTV